MFFDLAIIETGNGGDLVRVGNDLGVVNGIENMPYLGMYGGNVEQVTSNLNIATDAQNFDWWGNNLLLKNDAVKQFNSVTEKTLKTTELTSAGRIKIEAAIVRDLKFLSTPDISVEVIAVVIVSTDRIECKLRVKINPSSQEKITIVTLVQRDGDFALQDFDPNDFF